MPDSLQAAYRDAEALKRQDQLIAEEFELQKLEEHRAKAQAEKEKEKKAKKKVGAGCGDDGPWGVLGVPVAGFCARARALVLVLHGGGWTGTLDSPCASELTVASLCRFVLRCRRR